MIRILDEEGHPIIGRLLTRVRDQVLQRDRDRFRSSLRRLGTFLGYEVARELPSTSLTVTTPLGERAEPVLSQEPVIATVMRAGPPLWEGLLHAFPHSDSLILGAARVEGRVDPATGLLPIDISYQSKASLEGRPLVYADPMLATGSTLRALHPRVLERGGEPTQVFVVGVIAYRPTLELLAASLDATVIVASADDELNDRGYIIPGLGDAGDLAFGPESNG